LLHEVISQIQPLNEKAMEKAQAHLDQLTKPQGSLGRLEELSLQIAGITGDPKKVLADKRSIIMAADHGVVAEGVSAFPQEVTKQMVFNFLQGGAAISVITRQGGARVTCVDVGVAADLPQLEGLVHKKVAYGTKNMCQEPAMTREQVLAAIEAGIEVAFQQIEDGATLLATGEMGIGNTTASSAVLAVLASCAVEEVVGKGTGIHQEALQHKTKVIQQALSLHQPDANDPLDVLQKVGGFELCALAGLVLGSAARRVPIIVDGFITTVAVLCAVRLCPQARDYLIPSHLSEEPGHRIALAQLGLKPMLHMNMRLGEGSGAALLFPMIDTAQRIMQEMATFAEAGVSEKSE
jgi:nicotinate-nucleotide--dimethylbenzimidazole phosphoribosyltransferase